MRYENGERVYAMRRIYELGPEPELKLVPKFSMMGVTAVQSMRKLTTAELIALGPRKEYVGPGHQYVVVDFSRHGKHIHTAVLGSDHPLFKERDKLTIPWGDAVREDAKKSLLYAHAQIHGF